ncbi:MAG TPA: PhzF family phenazine biosynthesis protein [Thermoleophilaceae bacterium]|jgi:trans-2,3-dihydro-3-hydroxyanthranilate isomerase
MARFRYVIADVFTGTPLTGNQLAVFTDAREIPEDRYQDIAREMNFSETVFVFPPSDGDAHVHIRIFTPAAELPFAGHPTLGSAFVLAGPLQLTEIRLQTGIGVVPVRVDREGARISFGRMVQPIPTWQPYDDEAEALAALGVERSELPVESYENGPRHVFVRLASEDAVAAVDPDMGRLRKLGTLGFSTFAGDGTRWKTRMFGPGMGVSEDPATGSAAGPLGVHLLRHGLTESGQEIELVQGVEIKRPSKLYVRVTGTPDQIDSVEVGGEAVIVANGELQL